MSAVAKAHEPQAVALMFCLLAVGAGMSSARAQNGLAELRAQDEKVIREAPGIRFDVNIGRPVPNVELPAQISAAEGKVTFFADFENAGPKGVPLFLVNRTGLPLDMLTQDNDPFLKLEFRDEKGRWRRAQPHVSSWCGNSYYPVTLPPGQHFRFFGYLPAEGTPATIRYRSVTNPALLSNTGPGRVNPTDVAAAAMDAQAAAAIPWTLRNVLDATQWNSSKNKVTPSQYAAALNMLSQYHDSQFYRREAKRYLETIDADLPEATMIETLLNQDWPADPDRFHLLKFALAAVSGNEIDSLHKDTEMSWRVMRDLLVGQKEPVDPEWSQVVCRIYERIGESMDHLSGREAEAVAGVLALPIETDEFVSTGKLRDWLDHENSSVVEICAHALSRRGDRRFLAEKGFLMNPEAQILILKALASGGDTNVQFPRNPEDPTEGKFWKHCATIQPVETVSALQFMGSAGAEAHRFNLVLHDPLRDFLEKQADLAEKDPQSVSNQEHGYPVAQVLRFVGTWKRKEDIPLFQRLLKHPGFQSGIVFESKTRRFELRGMRVRQDAKSVLISMGISVPDDLVLEERIPLVEESGTE